MALILEGTMSNFLCISNFTCNLFENHSFHIIRSIETLSKKYYFAQSNFWSCLKFIYSEKATKIWHNLSFKGQKIWKQFMVSSILPKNEQKITILSIFSLENTHDRDILFIFWKNWEHHNLLWDFWLLVVHSIGWGKKISNANSEISWAHCVWGKKEC